MDAGYIPFHPNPSKPTYKPPAGAIDTHCHVFGPEAVFPFSPERKYTPCDAPKEKLFALRDFLGFDRNVIVQATCHGTDNRALVDALKASNGKAKGVAFLGAEASDEELRALDAAGVNGVRFNFLPRLVGDANPDVYLEVSKRVAAIGWHVDVYFEAPTLHTIIPFLEKIPTTIVLDHMSLPDVTKGVDHPQFQDYLRMLDEHQNVWVKVTCPERVSKTGPPYDDVVPYARAIVERFTDRIVWGTDWPHPNMTTHAPDDGLLVDMIPKFAPEPAQQRAMLIDNPERLYWAKVKA
jgi:2-pyrone-4,6-dicarboxylate lactonase